VSVRPELREERQERATRSTIEYYFVREWVASERLVGSHAHVLELLSAAVRDGIVCAFETRERAGALPQDEHDQAMLDACRAFSVRRGIKGRRAPRRNPYGWFPAQLLILREGDRIEAVFPCEIEGKIIEPEQLLDALLRGEAWSSVISAERADKGAHRELVMAIISDPRRLEVGIRLVGQNAWVADGSGERGYVDLVFIDATGRYLLIEVKIKAGEIDQGIGQLLKQSMMFAKQNFLELDRLRLGLVCPEIPAVRRAVCARVGIECFELRTLATAR
jgi:hypothetical protein